MIDLINDIFLNNDFVLQDLEWSNTKIKTYVNKKSETYILYSSDKISSNLPEEILSFCADEVYVTDKLTQAQKSNLSIIVTCKVNQRLSDIEKNIIYKIEESDLYYKKFFLWYTQEELNDLMKIIDHKYTSHMFNTILTNKELFDNFKKDQSEDKAYSLLSRIYIKFQFLTLNELEILDRTLFEYLQDEFNIINKQLFEYIDNHLNAKTLVDNSIELVELQPHDLALIDKELRELVDLNE